MSSQSTTEVRLMNLTVHQNNTIQYREQDSRYDSDTLLELESELGREPSQGKRYRQKRSSTRKRRKAPKASHPGCGIAGRGNRQWTW
jgi:hypothetical protein